MRVERRASIKTWNSLSGIGHLNEHFSSDTIPVSKTQYESILRESWAFKEKREFLARLGHRSEIDLDKAKFDVVINNDGTLADLEKEVIDKVVPLIKKKNSVSK